MWILLSFPLHQNCKFSEIPRSGFEDIVFTNFRDACIVRSCAPHRLTIAPACCNLAGMAVSLVVRCLSGVGCRGLASKKTCSWAGHYKYIQHKALTDTHTRTVITTVTAQHPYIDTSHTWGCALDHYENWPQCWLWIVIPASASMVTAKEHEHEHVQ